MRLLHLRCLQRGQLKGTGRCLCMRLASKGFLLGTECMLQQVHDALLKSSTSSAAQQCKEGKEMGRRCEACQVRVPPRQQCQAASMADSWPSARSSHHQKTWQVEEEAMYAAGMRQLQASQWVPHLGRVIAWMWI